MKNEMILRDVLTNFRGQRAIITALPSGENLEVKDVKEPKIAESEQLDGQMDITDFLKEGKE